MWNAKISFTLLLCAALTATKSEADSLACEEKEKKLAVLDLAKESIIKAKDLHPTCVNDDPDISSNSSKCGVKEKVSAYLDIAMNLIDEARTNYSVCDDTRNITEVVIIRNQTETILLHKKPIDCSQILENGDTESGIYTIWPNHRILGGRPLRVYCDMETNDGGWTVIQRRGDFSPKIDFYRNWHDYKHGFGNITQEFWIGNEKIFALTNQRNYEVRFDIQRVDKQRFFAAYSSFYIDDEDSGYMLHFGNYTGTAGDGIPTLRNMKFSTKDKRNDIWAVKPCTDLKKGGWWYSDCGGTNPNGINNPKADGAEYVNWGPLTKYKALLAIEIKIRPEN
ncbi:techylectin-like protein isoform X1 [Argiope bruennichi]|uniref:techylectin-like protein isoform X1 n=1 Tax=Argiope bruennichi TaxID=94029 RepID=UPI0024956338|nr:techylectin-like protein isoform X1 [Argiope bruennichi]